MADRQSKTLWIVLLINLSMFFIEGAYGLIANSISLLADSLDMLGDSLVYGMSLYAIGRSIKWNASISLLKGVLMGVFGFGVLMNAVFRFFIITIPTAETMGIIGALALVANITCAALLLKHRNSDLNMRSTWLCSRNDVIANIGVLAAAAAVAYTGSRYPDLIVGIAIAFLVLRSSLQVLRESIQLLQSRS